MDASRRSTGTLEHSRWGCLVWQQQAPTGLTFGAKRGLCKGFLDRGELIQQGHQEQGEEVKVHWMLL